MRRRPRKTSRDPLPPIKWRQVPKWVRVVAAAEGYDGRRLVELLNAARLEPYLVTQEPFFNTLADTAEERFRKGTGTALLEVLDLVPEYLEYYDQFPWMVAGLRELFRARAYVAFKPLRERVGKVGSGEDEMRHYVVESLRRQFGISQQEAIHRVAKAEGVSVKAVQKNLERHRTDDS